MTSSTSSTQPITSPSPHLTSPDLTIRHVAYGDNRKGVWSSLLARSMCGMQHGTRTYPFTRLTKPGTGTGTAPESHVYEQSSAEEAGTGARTKRVTASVGDTDGGTGERVGSAVGPLVGRPVGECVGLEVIGAAVGPLVGRSVGECVGLEVGE